MGRTCYICGSLAKPLFEFPQDKKERKKWIKVLQGSFDRKVDYKTAVLCTKHFSPESLDYSRRTCKLNPGAIPLLLDINEKSENNDSKTEKLAKSKQKKESQVNEKKESPVIEKKESQENEKKESEVNEKKESEVNEKNGEEKENNKSKNEVNEPIEDESATDPSTDGTGSEFDDKSQLFPEPVTVLTDDEKIKLLRDNFVFAIPQVPVKLSAVVHQQLPREQDGDEMFLEKARVHCTVCQKHIGTAPIAQIDRFMHPDLNTLVCEACFHYHGSGEFTKDEDGSEIYCKWCAQGGTVMCCSACPLVFCQQCVKNNLGAAQLKIIEEVEDWKCFKCDPAQLAHLQIIAFVLHRYTIRQLSKFQSPAASMEMKKDITKCCLNAKPVANRTPKKRKKSYTESEDEEFIPYKSSRRSYSKPSEAAKKDEVSKATVKKSENKTPNTTTVKTPIPIQPKPLIRTIPLSSLLEKTHLQPIKLINTAPITTTATIPAHMKTTIMNDVSKESPMNEIRPITSNQHINLAPRIPGLGIPQRISIGPRGLLIAPKPTQTAENPAAPVRLRMICTKQVPDAKITDNTPLVKTAWLMKSIAESKASFQALVTQADEITREAKLAKTHGQLAGLHNKMQHAMSKCTNALIEARKKMHRDFLAYLSKMNVSHSSFAPNGNVVNNIQAGPRHPGTIQVRSNLQGNFSNPTTANMTRLQKVPRPRAIIYPPALANTVVSGANTVVLNKHPILITKSTQQLILPKLSQSVLLPKTTQTLIVSKPSQATTKSKTAQPLIMSVPLATLMPPLSMAEPEKDPLALDEEPEVDPSMLLPEISMQVDPPFDDPPITIKTEKIDEDDMENVSMKL